MNKIKINTILDILIFILMLSMFVTSGEIHEMLAYTLGACIVAHLVLHWSQFKVMYKKLVPNTTGQVAVGILVVALAVAVLAMPAYLGFGEMGNDGERGRGYGPPPGQYQTMDNYQQSLDADQ